jgi:hypothetical protein
VRLRWVRLPRDTREIATAVRDVRARLVVIDPLMAYLDPSVNAYREQSIRGVLGLLGMTAERLDLAMVIVRHLTKSADGNPLYRGGGSIGVIGAARSGLVVGADPHDPTGRRRVLAVAKGNLTAPPPSLAYTLETVAADQPPLPAAPPPLAAGRSPLAPTPAIAATEPPLPPDPAPPTPGASPLPANQSPIAPAQPPPPLDSPQNWGAARNTASAAGGAPTAALRVAWAGPVPHTAVALLARATDPADGADRDARAEAIAFLQALLADGPMPTPSIIRAARQAGLAHRTIRRAKVALGILARKDGDGGWSWTLP